MSEFSYHKATVAELERVFEKYTAEYDCDEQYRNKRDEFIELNKSGRAVTFVVTCDGEPVGQGTLMLSPECPSVGGRLTLADNISVGNISSLCIDREYRGEGHISALVRRIEAHARSLRLHALTVGVEADKPKIISIYFHWGYTTFTAYEIRDNVPFVYYKKTLD